MDSNFVSFFEDATKMKIPSELAPPLSFNDKKELDRGSKKFIFKVQSRTKALKFELSEKHTKFDKIFLMVCTFTYLYIFKLCVLLRSNQEWVIIAPLACERYYLYFVLLLFQVFWSEFCHISRPQRSSSRILIQILTIFLVKKQPKVLNTNTCCQISSLSNLILACILL